MRLLRVSSCKLGGGQQTLEGGGKVAVQAEAAGVDAIIVQDVGLACLAHSALMRRMLQCFFCPPIDSIPQTATHTTPSLFIPLTNVQ